MNTTTKTAVSEQVPSEEMKRLIDDGVGVNFPKKGDVVGGVVISVGRNEVRVDIGGIAIGLVRGLNSILTRTWRLAMKWRPRF